MPLSFCSVLIVLFLFSCTSPGEKKPPVPPPGAFTVHAYPVNDSVPGDSMIIHIGVINSSNAPVGIREALTSVSFLPVSGWEKQGLRVFSYDGPGKKTLHPGDSAVYEYHLIDFFSGFTPGSNTLTFQQNLWIGAGESPLVLTDSLSVFIKE
jgi:hypothetical protein